MNNNDDEEGDCDIGDENLSGSGSEGYCYDDMDENIAVEEGMEAHIP